MPTKIKPIPEGYRTATPHLVVHDAAGAIDFYKRAFGARERMRMEAPGGKIGHAEIQIGDSIVMLSDEMPGSSCRSPQSLGGNSGGVFLYFDSVDRVFSQAVAAGARGDMPPQDMFWGDRFGRLTDPYGHSWSLATHIEDVAPEEMARRYEEFTRKMMQQRQAGGAA